MRREEEVRVRGVVGIRVPVRHGQGQEGRGGLLGPEPLLSQQVAREEMERRDQGPRLAPFPRPQRPRHRRDTRLCGLRRVRRRRAPAEAACGHGRRRRPQVRENICGRGLQQRQELDIPDQGERLRIRHQLQGEHPPGQQRLPGQGPGGRVMVQNPVQGVDGGHRIPLPVEERDRVQRFQGDLPGDREGHVRPGHGPGGHGEDGGLQRVQEGEGGDNEGHRERGGGGLTRRRRGRAHPFIVSDLSNRV